MLQRQTGGNPARCMNKTKESLHPSAAAEQGLFHSRDTEAFRPHLHLNVLLSPFQWGLHEIHYPPETFLESHPSCGRARLDVPGPAFAHFSQMKFQAKLLWAQSSG